LPLIQSVTIDVKFCGVRLLQERDEWVSAIEQQILSSLQLNLSDKSKVCSVPAFICIKNVKISFFVYLHSEAKISQH